MLLVLAFRCFLPHPEPTSLGLSPAILPKPADGTAPHIHITGYFFLDRSESYQPCQEPAGFLAAGEYPVCETFGSMIQGFNRDKPPVVPIDQVILDPCLIE